MEDMDGKISANKVKAANENWFAFPHNRLLNSSTSHLK